MASVALQFISTQLMSANPRELAYTSANVWLAPLPDGVADTAVGGPEGPKLNRATKAAS